MGHAPRHPVRVGHRRGRRRAPGLETRATTGPSGTPTGSSSPTPDYRITGAGAGLEIKKSERGDDWGDDGDPLGPPRSTSGSRCSTRWPACRRGRSSGSRCSTLRPGPPDVPGGAQRRADRAPRRRPCRNGGSGTSWTVSRSSPTGPGQLGRALRALYPHPTEDPRPATAEEERVGARVPGHQGAGEGRQGARRDPEPATRALHRRRRSHRGRRVRTATYAEQRGRIDWKAAAEAAGITEVTAEGVTGRIRPACSA